MTTNISKLVWTGAAKETTAGTAITTPTIYIPCESTWTRKTKYVYAKEERGTRDGNNRRVGTTRMSSGELKGSVYLNSFGYLLMGFMGAPAAATQPDEENAADAYSHAFTLADVPPSLTLFKGYDHMGFSFAYSTVNKLKLSFSADGKLLEHQTSIESQYGTEISGGTYTSMNDPEYEDSDALAGYLPLITLGGSTSVTDISEFEIELEQKISLYYSARGNRAFLKADYDERTAAISFTGRFEDSSWTDKEKNDTREELEISISGANLGGSVVENLDIDFASVAYDEVVVDTSKEAIMAKVKCTAMPTSTKNSLFSATLINSTEAYTS